VVVFDWTGSDYGTTSGEDWPLYSVVEGFHNGPYPLYQTLVRSQRPESDWRASTDTQALAQMRCWVFNSRYG
jgi:hypothetical protein